MRIHSLLFSIGVPTPISLLISNHLKISNQVHKCNIYLPAVILRMDIMALSVNWRKENLKNVIGLDNPIQDAFTSVELKKTFP